MLSLQYLHPPYLNKVPAVLQDILPHLLCLTCILAESPLYSDKISNSSLYLALISSTYFSCVFLIAKAVFSNEGIKD